MIWIIIILLVAGLFFIFWNRETLKNRKHRKQMPKFPPGTIVEFDMEEPEMTGFQTSEIYEEKLKVIKELIDKERSKLKASDLTPPEVDEIKRNISSYEEQKVKCVADIERCKKEEQEK